MPKPPEAVPYVLFARHLAKSYVDYPVVGDVSLFVRRAETVALLGPGGAGKSTVFRLLIGILQPDAGRIFLEGVDITEIPVYERARRGLSYLPQEPSVIRTLTVEQNLLFALEAREPDAARRHAIVDELLIIFGIQDVRATRAGRISGGERRRCEIARTMAGRPKFVLLDEPFAGLDPLGITDMRAAIGLLTKHGVGVLITDHNIRDTLSFVDRAYIIDSGRILMEGSASEVIANPEVRRAYLGAGFSL
jgi:lipopolysaccharide export system ATP-binding protein